MQHREYVTPRSVLITDGTERASLAAARSLRAAGYDVHVSTPRRRSLASVSRGVHPAVVIPDPLADPDGYAAALSGIVRDRGIDVLLPIVDASVEAILEHRSRFPSTLLIPLPNADAYRKASDKLEILELARTAGFVVPRTLVLNSPEELGSVPSVGYPAVVKPHRSVVTAAGRRVKTIVTIAPNLAACRRALAKLPKEAFPVLLQEHIAGVGEGLFALRWQGRTQALFAHRRLREKPPTGGVSVYRESIALPPDLVRAGERLLGALDWQGVAMIECKRDPRTGRHVIMEVNGRFWGSLQLAIDAGVDFPALLVACALGQPPAATVDHYHTGIRSRWFWGDVDHLFLRFKDSLDGGSSRLRAVLDFLTVRPGRDRNEIWRWRDPAPALLETLQWFGVGR